MPTSNRRLCLSTVGRTSRDTSGAFANTQASSSSSLLPPIDQSIPIQLCCSGGERFTRAHGAAAQSCGRAAARERVAQVTQIQAAGKMRAE